MSNQIHVCNQTNTIIKVQCFDKDTDQVTISPGQATLVYDKGGTKNPDVNFQMYNNINKTNGGTQQVKIKETQFQSNRDTSWIVYDTKIVQQEYGAGLCEEDPNGKEYGWNITADSIELQDVNYSLESLDGYVPQWILAGSSSQVVLNKTDATLTQNASTSVTYSASNTWSNNVGLTLQETASVEAGIPLFAKGTFSISGTETYSYTWGGSDTKSFTYTNSVAVPVKPNTQQTVTSYVWETTVNVNYSATLILGFNNSTDTVITNVEGTYEGVCANKTSTEVSEPESINQN